MPTAGSGHSAKLPPLPSASLIRRLVKGRVGALSQIQPGSPSHRQTGQRRPAPPLANAGPTLRRARQPSGRRRRRAPPHFPALLPFPTLCAATLPRATCHRPSPHHTPRAGACPRQPPPLRPHVAEHGLLAHAVLRTLAGGGGEEEEEPALPPAVPRGPPARTLPMPDPVPDSGDLDPDPDARPPLPPTPVREEPVGAKSEFPSLCRFACTASPHHYTDPHGPTSLTPPPP
ncbi:proline-rich receptor-like protein kinase PERK2 [Miscanthus floridulus]|uniref:proline-rich receptor-like protein kinase PERK2 n=1 Tax=Miscanthus floridulus TaxID=154761 RepID=UPI003459576B